MAAEKAKAQSAVFLGHGHSENASLGQFADRVHVPEATGIAQFSGSSTTARALKQGARALTQQAKVFLVAEKHISLYHLFFAGS